METLKTAGRRTLLIISGLLFAAVFAFGIYIRYLAVKDGGLSSVMDLFEDPLELAAEALMLLGWLLLALGCLADRKGMYLFGAFAGLGGSGINAWQAVSGRGQAVEDITETMTQLERAEAAAGTVTACLMTAAFLFLFFSMLVGHRKIALLTLLPVLLYGIAVGTGFLIYSHFGQQYFTGTRDWRVAAVTAAGLFLASAATGISKAQKREAPAPASTGEQDEVPKGAESSESFRVDEVPQAPVLELPNETAPAPSGGEDGLPKLELPEMELPKLDMHLADPENEGDAKDADQ